MVRNLFIGNVSVFQICQIVKQKNVYLEIQIFFVM